MLQLLTQLEQLANEIAALPEEDRVLFYQRISPIILAIKGELRRTPSDFAQNKVTELEWHLTTIAHLDEADGQTDQEHLTEALQILRDLRGPKGFGGAGT